MNIKEEIGQRILQARKAKGLTRKALADLTDDLKQSRINNWERGERTPGPEEVKQLAKALDVSAAYLMCFTNEERPKRIPGLGALIPLLDLVQARNPIPYIVSLKNEQHADDVTYIPIHVELAATLGENAFALKMKDNSMSPELRVNDIVVVDPAKEVNPGGFVVALIDGQDEILIRQYRQLSASKTEQIYELRVTNDAWANIRIDQSNQGKIVGTVISILRVL